MYAHPNNYMNSQVNEQDNARLQHIKSRLAYMTKRQTVSQILMKAIYLKKLANTMLH